MLRTRRLRAEPPRTPGFMPCLSAGCRYHWLGKRCYGGSYCRHRPAGSFVFAYTSPPAPALTSCPHLRRHIHRQDKNAFAAQDKGCVSHPGPPQRLPSRARPPAPGEQGLSSTSLPLFLTADELERLLVKPCWLSRTRRMVMVVVDTSLHQRCEREGSSLLPPRWLWGKQGLLSSCLCPLGCTPIASHAR